MTAKKLCRSLNKFKLSTKIWGVLSLLLIPFVLLLHFYNSTIEAQLRETTTSHASIDQILLLSELQESIAQFRGLHRGQQQSLKHRVSTPTPHKYRPLLIALEEKIDLQLVPLQTIFISDIQQWQIEAIQSKWGQITTAESPQYHDTSSYNQLIQQINSLIEQVARPSTSGNNRQHNLKTQIFTLSTHFIPTLKEELGLLRGDTFTIQHPPHSEQAYHNYHALFLLQRERINNLHLQLRDHLARIYTQEPYLYQQSFSIFANYSIELAALLDSLQWSLNEAEEEQAPLQITETAEHLFQQFSFQIELLDQLSSTLLDYVKSSLLEEQQQLEQQRSTRFIILVPLLAGVLLSIQLILNMRSRGLVELSNYLKRSLPSRQPPSPSTEPSSFDASTLDGDQQKIWNAYQLLEQQLRQETALLHSLKQGLDIAAMIFVTDPNGTIRYANEALLQKTKFPLEEVIGKTPRIFRSNQSLTEIHQRLWKTILSGNIWKYQMINSDRDGTPFWVDETIIPLKDENGAIQEFFTIQFDITIQKMAEQKSTEQIQQLESVQAIASDREQQIALLEQYIENPDSPSFDEVEKIDPVLENHSAIERQPVIEEDYTSTETEAIRILAIDDDENIIAEYQSLLQSERIDHTTNALHTLLNKTAPTDLNNSARTHNRDPHYQLDCVTSGEAAIEKIIAASKSDNPYQVICLDLLMPGGWDGVRTAREIVQIDPMVRIIIVSAWSEHNPAELDHILHGRFTYLTKPFNNNELLQLTRYLADDWNRTHQLTTNQQNLSKTMIELNKLDQERKRQLDHQQIYQMILVTLSTSAPLYSGDRQLGFNEITQATLEALGAERVTIWRLEQEENKVTLIADDCYSVANQEHSSGDKLDLSDYPEVWEQIKRTQVVRVDDTSQLPTCQNDENCYFLENNIQAIMIAPIFYNKVQIGLITTEMESNTRNWSPEEATFLSYVSNLVPTVEVSAERRTAELKAEQANRAKDDFLATMSHELRTPLSSMIGYGEILRESSLTTKQRDLVDTIELAGKTLLALVNDILDISKIEAGKFELDIVPFNLCSLIHEVDMMFTPKASMKGLSFKITTEGELPSTLLNGDERRILQILINLIGNALKFTSQGSVILNISSETTQSVDGRAIARYHYAITDTGIGIAPDAMERLFKPFEQADGTISRSFGGTGLGLYISHILSELMGGAIKVTSVEDEGSTFEVIVPLEVTDTPAPDTMTQTPEAAESPTQELSGRVLVAEDTVELQILERRLVEATGATVDIANDGEEAVTMALTNPYDLILMDMQMPKMDGISATQLLRGSAVSTPIVALTANVMQKHRDQFKEAGCNDFLSKPISRPALMKVLHNYLTEISGEALDKTIPDNDMPFIDPELMKVFKERIAESHEQIDQYYSQQAWSELQKVIHSLKGSGASFGFSEITEQATIIEKHLRAGQHEQLAPLIDTLQQTLQNTAHGE